MKIASPTTKVALEALVLAQLCDAAADSAAGAVDWPAWPLSEQAQALQRRVEQIDYKGVRGLISIHLRAADRAVEAESPARPHPDQAA